MLVQLKNLTKSFGSQTVLDKINLTVNEKDRLGIVGVNGAGKTTLFNIIAGALEAEAYENATDAVYVRKGLKIGYLRQVEAVESQNTLYGEIRRSFAEIDRIAAQLEALTEKISCAKPDSAEYAGLAEKFDKLSSYYQSIGGYDTEFKIRRVLNGMGFSDKSPDMKAQFGKRALAVLTVSDCPLRGESLPAEQRQTSFTQMIEIALETAE